VSKKHWTDGEFLLDFDGNPYTGELGKGGPYFYPGADSLDLAQMAHAAERRLRRAQIEHTVASREGAPKAEKARLPELAREEREAQADRDRIKRILAAKRELRHPRPPAPACATGTAGGPAELRPRS
jgi:hypothetical protein